MKARLEGTAFGVESFSSPSAENNSLFHVPSEAPGMLHPWPSLLSYHFKGANMGLMHKAAGCWWSSEDGACK